MNADYRRGLVLSLRRTLHWMVENDDWFSRSTLATRAMGAIFKIGVDIKTYFEMDSEYLVDSYENVKKFRAKLNDIIDMPTVEGRQSATDEFVTWLHEIKLLRPGE